MIVLGRSEVAALLDPDALVEAVATALRDLSAGKASVPPRIASFTPAGLLGAMVGYVPSLDVLAAKLVSVFPQNVGTSTHQALIAVFDPRSGAPLALLDGEEITAQRTAAGSALATRLLAREDARVLAIVGTGVQAASHARYVARDAVRAADVICATTHAREPVVRRDWLRPGAHVNSVGLHPQGREIDTLEGMRVAVESRTSAFAPPPAGANELRDTSEAEAVELGELSSGTRTGRASDAQITVYKSVGVAAEDAAAAALVLRRARERGVGRTIEL